MKEIFVKITEAIEGALLKKKLLLLFSKPDNIVESRAAKVAKLQIFYRLQVH